MMSILNDPRRMARLKLSIGTRTHERPMTPAEVACAIRDFGSDTGESIYGIAKRLKVHPDTCRMFLAILDLPQDWRDVWHFGRSDSGLLPFSMASKLGARFKDGRLTKDDLDLLKGAVLDPQKPARRDDIANILSYHSKNPDKTLSECIADIMRLTPTKVTDYVMITDIDPGFLEPDLGAARDKISGVLKRHFAGHIKEIRIKDNAYLFILFDKEGYDIFYALAKREGVPAKKLVNHLCSRPE